MKRHYKVQRTDMFDVKRQIYFGCNVGWIPKFLKAQLMMAHQSQCRLHIESVEQALNRQGIPLAP
ncbi:MAG: hypothetical protein ACR2JB_13590 [Bryobacteraceae bacterium]